MKKIVISGINIFEGGTLTVYHDCLDQLISDDYYKKFDITVFVHKKELFEKYEEFFRVIELPNSRKNYLYRMYYEYFYFHKFSKTEDVFMWLSIHDISPRVKAEKRYVYCHNSTPFFKMDFKKIKFGWKIFLFSLFYKFIYKINIKKNTGVIVQQDWLRTEFSKMFGINNIIVATPILKNKKKYTLENNNKKDENTVFLYPSYPRFFKNFEVLCEATKILNTTCEQNFEVKLTLSGEENNYSRYLFEKYKDVKNLDFIGIQKKDDLFLLYDSVNSLVFSSELETWGLPITEFKSYNKTIIVSDLPYAHETISDYKKAVFFNPNDAVELSRLMENEINEKTVYANTQKKIVSEPYAEGWKELLVLLVSK